MDKPIVIPLNISQIQNDGLDFKDTNYHFPDYYKVLATAYLAIIDIFIIIGNVWVIFIILSKLRKSMYLLSSLVVSDLLTGITSIPLYLLWLHHVDLFISHPMCFGSLMTSLFLTSASILNIVAMTTERYIAICHPMFHKSFVKVNFRVILSVTIAGIWLTSFLISLFSFIFMKRDFLICSYYNVYNGQFLFWAIILGVFTPFCLLSVMYVKMFLSVKKCFKRQIVQRIRLTSSSSQSRQKNIYKALRKMVSTLCLVLTCFVFCWFPFFITIVLRVVCKECELPILAYEIILLLGLTNSFTNPIIYCLRHRSFRLSWRPGTSAEQERSNSHNFSD